MITILIVLLLSMSQSKMHHPKKLFGIQRKPISIIQLISEPLIGQERTTEFQKERLEFDANLVLQQELIEEDVSEFPKANYTMPKFEKQSERALKGYKQEFQKVKELLIEMHYQRVLICLFAVSVFSAFIWCIIKLCILFRPPTEQKQQKQSNDDYSILNSKTISEEDLNNNYRITDMTPQIRNPYDESFVKASIKFRTTCDQSLLEIDELLQELK